MSQELQNVKLCHSDPQGLFLACSDYQMLYICGSALYMGSGQMYGLNVHLTSFPYVWPLEVRLTPDNLVFNDFEMQKCWAGINSCFPKWWNP